MFNEADYWLNPRRGIFPVFTGKIVGANVQCSIEYKMHKCATQQ